MNNKSKSSRGFIFLQFLDAEINAFLSALRREFGNSRTENSIHVTVRGPYSGRISGKNIAKYQDIIRHDPILIHGVDIFQSQTGNVVYIRVHSDSLKKIWWKPDFPVKKFGFNPHITLHKTPDIEFARTISDFLKKEEIELICHEFRLIPFVSKQGEFFPFDPSLRDRRSEELPRRPLVRPDILHRAANVVEEYRRRYASGDIALVGRSTINSHVNQNRLEGGL